MEKEDLRTAKSERLQRAESRMWKKRSEGSEEMWKRSRMSSCDSRLRSRIRIAELKNSKRTGKQLS